MTMNSISGLTRSVVGTGTENGLPYIDFRLQGTPATNILQFLFEAGNIGVAANGQEWCSSFFVGVVGGTTANVLNLSNLLFMTDAAGAFLAGLSQTVGIGSVPASMPAGRFTNPQTLNNAGTIFVQSGMNVQMTVGQPVDITLRIGAPNLEEETNLVPNYAAAGAIAGTPGTFPTGWSLFPGGLSSQIVSSGTDGLGIEYCDIRLFGTPTAAFANVAFNPALLIPGVNGSSHHGNIFLALTSGTFTNVRDITLRASVSDVINTYLNEVWTPTFITSLNATLTRYNEGGTITSVPTAAWLGLYCQIRLTIGLAVDFTIRFGRPKLAPSIAMAATSPIITSGTQVERPADALSIVLPPGSHNLTFVFDNGTSQTITGLTGTYTVPTNLNRAYIARINSLTTGGVLASTGVSTAAFVGSSVTGANSVLNTSGSSTATFVSSALAPSVLTTLGVGTAAFVGQGLTGANGVLNASGTGTATFLTSATAPSVLVTGGTTTVSFFTGASQAASFAITGSTVSAFTGASNRAGILQANGLSTAAFASAISIGANGVVNPAGSSTASFFSSATKPAVLSSGGSTLVAFSGRWTAAAQFQTTGSTTALFTGSTVRKLTANQSFILGQAAAVQSGSLDGPPIWLEGSIEPDSGLTGSIDSDIIYGSTAVLELEGEV
jgi:hypothetical protein